MENLITLDEFGRMVPTDREALLRAVTALLDEPLEEPAPLRRAGVGLLVLGRREEAIATLERALALADNKRAVAVHINLGDAHRYGGDLEAAEPHYQRALQLCQEHAPDLRYFCLQHLGKQRLDQGRTREARALLEDALRQRRAQGDPALIAATETALRLVDRAEAAATP
ncbi:tetratricopeptide repeat protein [Streptacidiphilus sp. P02-A3a]|uniref:tetratricopeptide repeat protein n=1 Tax=Streptacidiphilus sp. P02-A3a TaxID=2704468 RepID=UPI0015FA514A|nr:tetratricopeptide repeat protein [Streptacidiphilus sp. P02-A3a]QMU71095.1 tetratricopeptide repeat protein [Streptacidiphilus sp. P02-A3a]